MAEAQRLTREEIDSLPTYPFLQSLQNLPEPSRSKFLRSLLRIHRKKVAIPLTMDWTLAENSGLTAELGQFLSKSYYNNDGDLLFTCTGWWNIFHINQPIYKEYLMEFLSTVSFDTTEEDFTQEVFTFRLGGVTRQCSIVDLAWRLGIYTQTETQSPFFLRFLQDSLTLSPDDYSEAEFWSTIANGNYVPSTAQESSIRSPTHRLLHRLIANTVSHRDGTDKVPSHDLFYLWCLITPGRFLNLPYTIAGFLARRAYGLRATSPMLGGHLVARLADSYGLLARAATRGMTIQPVRLMTFRELEAMSILERGPGGAVRIRGAGQIEGVPAPAPQPRRQRQRRRNERAQAVPEEEIDLRYVARRIDMLQLDVELMQEQQRSREQLARQQREWMGSQLSSFFSTQGFSYPPFPTGPEAGPSGSHQQDSDDGEDDE